MKKYIFILSAIACLFTSSLAFGQTPSAILPDIAVLPGSSISIPLTVNNIEGLQGMGITIVFDEDVVDATGATLTGGVLENHDYLLFVNTNIDGEIIIGFVATGDLFSGSGVIANLEFDVVGSAGDYTDLTFTQFMINEISYLENVTNGSVSCALETSLSLPLDAIGAPGSAVSIPLTLFNPSAYPIEGIDVVITFDENILNATGATLEGGVLEFEDYWLVVNTNIPGEISIGISGSGELFTGSGIVAFLEFDVDPSATYWQTTDMVFTQADINEVPVNAIDGLFTVYPVMGSIDGVITLDGGEGEVEDVLVIVDSSDGYVVNPDTTGYYIFESIPIGIYNITASLEGYQDTTVVGIEVFEDETTTVDIILNVEISIDDPIIPIEFILEQNYPNPFGFETSIKFALPQPTHVRLRIYNVIGQLVETLVEKHMSAGEHPIYWDAKDRSSGIYFYRLETDYCTLTKKMLLIK